MNKSFWFQQTKDKPLYDDIIWSQPESRQARGKILIIGGNSHGFSAPGEAYTAAEVAKAGTIRVLLPQAIYKIFKAFKGPVLETEFAASNPSGSFSQKALGEWLDHAMWADAVLLAGDFGRNSETAIIIEKFLQHANVPTTITKDGVDYFIPIAKQFTERENITLALSMAQLQKLGSSLNFDKPFKLGMDLVQLSSALNEFTRKFPFKIIVKQQSYILVSLAGKVSSTLLEEDIDVWRVKIAAAATVWGMQNPSKPFEALTTSLVA